MELTLKRLLEQAKFTTTRKGYDQDEVDDFLDRAVAMATKVEARLTQALAEAKGAGGAGAPVAPSRGPGTADFEAEVERRVQARLAEAPSIAERPIAEHEAAAAEEVRRTIVMAQRTADAAVQEAKAEADALLAQAQARANALTTEADEAARLRREAAAAESEAARAEAHERLTGEISALEAARDGLRSDVSLLEVHVEEQRSQLRGTVAELQRLLEDPAVFRLAPTPVLRDAEVPTFEPAAPAADDPVGDETSEAAGAPADAGSVTDTPAEETGDPSGPSDPSDPWEPSDFSDRSDTAPAVEPQAQPGLDLPSGQPSVDQAAPSGVLAIEDIDHEIPGIDDSPDTGPPTAPVMAIDLGLAPPRIHGAGDNGPDGGDDAFLAELRKAMADEEPLGPREGMGLAADAGFLDEDRRGWRFGKRR